MVKLSLLIILLSLSSQIFARSRRFVAEVSMLRGEVSQLAPGEHLARKLSLGHRVMEDASVLTGNTSFVRLTFEDGSTISLGPNSKIVVYKMDKKGNGVVSLLKGRARTKVKEDFSIKKKFYLRTRNAALGVRGTEFETNYNPSNRVTSLLTYKGEVAMVQTDNRNKEATDLKNAKRVVRNVDNKIFLEEEAGLSKTSEKEIESLLKKESVIVKAGQLSQTLEKIKSVSQPVKISPVQLNALYKNKDLKTKDKSKVKGTDVDPSKSVQAIKSADQNAPAEGLYDPEKKLFAPKSGGFFDPASGLYIPPTSDATFDQVNKVYVASNIGSIDGDTGQYEAPLGLDLDPVEGFKLKNFNDKAPLQLIAMAKKNQKELNNNLARDVIVAKGKQVTKSGSFKPLSNRELISKNILTFSIAPFSQTINHENDNFLGGSRREFRVEDSRDLTLKLEYASSSKWQPVTYFTTRSMPIDPSTRGNFGQVGDKLTSLGVGVKYSLNSRWSILSLASLDQQYFLHHSTSGSTTTSQFIRVTVPNLMVGVQGTLIRSGRLSVESGFLTGTNFPKTTGDHKLSSGISLSYNMALKYWFSRNYIGELGYFGGFQQHTSSGTSQVYEAKVKRSINGLALKVSTHF